MSQDTNPKVPRCSSLFSPYIQILIIFCLFKNVCHLSILPFFPNSSSMRLSSLNTQNITTPIQEVSLILRSSNSSIFHQSDHPKIVSILYLFCLEKPSTFPSPTSQGIKFHPTLQVFQLPFQLPWLLTPPDTKLSRRQVGLPAPTLPCLCTRLFAQPAVPSRFLQVLAHILISKIGKLNQVLWKFKFGRIVNILNIINHIAHGIFKHPIKNSLELTDSGSQPPIQSKYLTKHPFLFKQGLSSGWCGSVEWVPACKPKGHWFDSQSGHMPRLWARSLVGGTWEATAHWCFSPSPLSLPLSLKINK